MTLALDLNGTTEVPAGKIAVIVTFLEYAGSVPRAPAALPHLSVAPVPDPEPAWYRGLYRRIGEDWLWFSRAVLDDRGLKAIIAAPRSEVLVIKRDGEDAGLAEISFAVAGEAEIVTFGVVPEETGSGAAHHLMDFALKRAFRPGIRRVWLHTCTADHPAALRFYRRAGFRPTKIAIEVADDPRLNGYLGREAAQHVPIIAP